MTHLLDEKTQVAFPPGSDKKITLTFRQLMIHQLMEQAKTGNRDAMKLLRKIWREFPDTWAKFNRAMAYDQGSGQGSGVLRFPYKVAFKNCPYHLAIAEAVVARREGRAYAIDPDLVMACSATCPSRAEPGLLPLPTLRQRST